MRLVNIDALIDMMKAQADCDTCKKQYGSLACETCTWYDAICLAEDFGESHSQERD